MASEKMPGPLQIEAKNGLQQTADFQTTGKENDTLNGQQQRRPAPAKTKAANLYV